MKAKPDQCSCSLTLDLDVSRSVAVRRSAVVSDCGRYRYCLRREWEDRLPRVCFVMLNPSTADGTEDDPTVRRCIGFARRWGFGSLLIVNLFAYRATRPSDLPKYCLGVDGPVGPDNDDYIRRACIESDALVLAWGQSGPDKRLRVAEVLRMVKEIGKTPLCLGTTLDGSPRHPLYVAADADLVRWMGGAKTLRDAEHLWRWAEGNTR